MVKLDEYEKLNKRTYFTFCFLAIIIMLLGLGTTFLRDVHWVALLIHSCFVLFLSFILFYYPFRETNFLRAVLMFTIVLFFYALFLLYPNTTSTLALIYLAPVATIVFFNRKLFTSILIFNLFTGSSLFIGLNMSRYRDLYSSVTLDIVGNLINFWLSGLIITLIFIITAERMSTIRTYFLRVQQAERLNTAGQLAASVAHEIRNPLTIVRGFLQLSTQKTILKEHTKLMIQELDQAEIIISNYLSLLKPEFNGSEFTNVENDIQAVTNLLYPFALMSKNEIQLKIADGLKVKITSMEIRQVLINVIKNAIESMESSTGVIIVKGFTSKGFVVIQVVDTGIGMTEAEVKELGTPFYSLKRKGTGIGLTICFDIIEKYKGRFEITSKPLMGTTVQISLPLSSENY